MSMKTSLQKFQRPLPLEQAFVTGHTTVCYRTELVNTHLQFDFATISSPTVVWTSYPRKSAGPDDKNTVFGVRRSLKYLLQDIFYGIFFKLVRITTLQRPNSNFAVNTRLALSRRKFLVWLPWLFPLRFSLSPTVQVAFFLHSDNEHIFTILSDEFRNKILFNFIQI